ncbi:hypothetical protein [Streptomyces pseudovenezuelae]|uniref:Tetracycline repressor TetR C-terminal domain-containing protein n=1 Tax=Streptomyces pseudovenezuelae TaxID=67350 RepID=A0ABT6LGT0_9ACTN|nr:hypothetical protein [Streptomyces pseudovenezuelae]MDH6215503.1 hypothetical protein [Streptomyces pseudovenezuelae]
MVDLVFGEVELPTPGDDWRQAMRQRAGSMRRVLSGPEIATAHVMRPGYTYGDEFEFGLELILNGLQQATS